MPYFVQRVKTRRKADVVEKYHLESVSTSSILWATPLFPSGHPGKPEEPHSQ